MLVFSAAVLCGCQKKMIKDNAGVNKWVHATMQERYLWSGTLDNYVPSDMHPVEYFEHLRYRDNLYTHLPYDIYGDRFSRITFSGSVSRGADASFSSGDRRNDFGFSYIVEGDECHITCVVPNSPAYVAGLKRGDIISEAFSGGTRLSWGQMEREQNLTLVRTFPTEEIVEVSKAVFYDTPVIFDSVYDTSAGKTGYLVYSHFSAGGADRFNNELRETVAQMKSKGITNLVLDLRYNGGGELNTAVLLASMLARPADRGSLFVYLERNKHAGQPYYNFECRNFMTANEIGGEQYCLDLDKLVIITTAKTASASELVLHGLKPFYGDNLIHIGQRTYGKNLGTVKITNLQYEWLLNIVSLRVYNRDGVSGFEDGIETDGRMELSDWTEPTGGDRNYILGDFGKIDGPHFDNMLTAAISCIDNGLNLFKSHSARPSASYPTPEYHGIEDRGLVEDEIFVN